MGKEYTTACSEAYEEGYLKVIHSDMINAQPTGRTVEDILYEQDSVNHSCGNRGVDEAQAEWEYNNLRNNK